MDTQTVTEKMSSKEQGIPREFVLKQIENEVSAGFALVAAARQAFKLSHPVAAEGALEKASEVHQQVLNEVTDSAAAQVRTVIHQLTELREAIDWLREAHFKAPHQE